MGYDLLRGTWKLTCFYCGEIIGAFEGTRPDMDKIDDEIGRSCPDHKSSHLDWMLEEEQ